MRILIAIDVPLVRELGAAQCALSLADGLRELGHDVAVWSPAAVGKPPRWFADLRGYRRQLKEHARTAGPFDLIDAPASLITPRLAALAPTVARSVQPELRYRWLEVVRALRSRPLSVWTGLNLVSSIRIWSSHLSGWRSAARILCLGSLEASWMAQRYPAWAGRISWYRAAPSDTDRRALQSIRKQRSNEGTSPDPRFLWIGRWTEHKGTKLVREWLMRSAADGPLPRLTIAGCGPNIRFDLPTSARDGGRIEIVPEFGRDELPAILARHDAGLFTSVVEGWGLSLQEMLESGLPVFASRAGAVPDLEPALGPLLRPFPPSAAVPTDALARIDWAEYERHFNWGQIARDYESFVTTGVAGVQGPVTNRLTRWIDGIVSEAALARAMRSIPPDGTSGEPRSIVILRNNDLGDLLIVTPLFEALRQRFPDARICAAVGSWAQSLLAGNPHLSDVLAVDAPWFNKYVKSSGPVPALRFAWRSPAVDQLRAERFNLGIDLLGSAWGALLLLRSGIPTRLGTLGYAGGERGFQGGVPFNPAEHVGRRALHFAELLGATDLPENRPQIFLSRQEKESGERAWRELRPDSGGRRPRIAIGPGAGQAEKAWPEERFRELVARLAAMGAFEIVVLGGPGERQLAGGIAAGAVANLAGTQSLREMIAAVSAADCVVCNSSLLLHAAAAFGKRTVVLLGPSFPSASHHQRQWGYDGYSVTLGAESATGQGLASVEEAFTAIRRAVDLPPEAALR